MKTVASISFLNNQSLSMDVEDVRQMEMTHPMELDPGLWTANLLIRSEAGTLAIQLLADNPEALTIVEALEQP